MNKYRRLIFAALPAIAIIPVIAASAAGQPTCAAAQVLTAKSCAGDATSPTETALFELVNKYRVANGRPALRSSVPLSMLANRRILDIKLNKMDLTHSWSDCPYDIKVEKTWPCVIDAPKRLNTGYKGEGFEALYRTASRQAEPGLAIQAWQKSPLHNSIILNEEAFKNTVFDEMGVAVDGPYAVLWLGSPGSGQKGMGTVKPGLGISYENAIAGLTKLFAITQASTEVESGKWVGTTADKKVKLELYGSKSDISEANVTVLLEMSNGKVSPQARNAVSTLLKKLFPEWPDSDAWLAATAAAITQDTSASRTKIIRKISIEMSSNVKNSLRLRIIPDGKKRYVEVF